MQRRGFVSGKAGLLAASAFPKLPEATDDQAAVRELVERVYSVFYKDRHKVRYIELLTDDYVLLEQGELLTREQDVASMPITGARYERTDSFDFKSVTISGDTAYAVYYLASDITDEEAPRHKQWLESVVARRASTGSRWRVALLHSTRIEQR